MCWCDSVCADCGHVIAAHAHPGTDRVDGGCYTPGCACVGWRAGACYPTGCPVSTVSPR